MSNRIQNDINLVTFAIALTASIIITSIIINFYNLKSFISLIVICGFILLSFFFFSALHRRIDSAAEYPSYSYELKQKKDYKSKDPSINIQKFSYNNINLTNTNLSGANLTHANLSTAELSSVNLSGANLASANLTRADLSDANLPEANLTNANLTSANLTSANLTSANLSNAILINSTYNNSIVTEKTNFTEAIIDNPNFIDYIEQFTSKVPKKIETKRELKTKLKERKLTSEYIKELVEPSKLPN